MLIKLATLEGIADGTVDTVYRRWRRPRVKAGSTLRTAIGVLAVDAVEATSLRAIDAAAAHRAGYASRAALLAELARHREGRLYRITLHRAGADPRIALRRRDRLDAAERAELEARLGRLGARSADGPWAFAVLRLIATRPAVRAADLAAELGWDTRRFKTRVRQLKELGLTESLEVGYRLSPRGRALITGDTE